MLLLRTGPSTRNTVKKEFYVGAGSLTGPDTGINTHLGGGGTHANSQFHAHNFRQPRYF